MGRTSDDARYSSRFDGTGSDDVTESRNVVYHLDVDGLGRRWGVRSVGLHEELLRPYECVIDATCDSVPEVSELLEVEVHLHIERGDGRRTVHGIVRHATVSNRVDGPSVRLHVVPAMWLMAMNLRSRVFTDMTIPEVVEAIYEERLGEKHRQIRSTLTRAYPKHELLVQYQESDLGFVQRRLEQEGIYFYFSHDGEHEELVLADANASLSEREGDTLSWTQGADAISVDGVFHAMRTEEVGPTDVVVVGHDWTKPTEPPRGEQTGRGERQPALEIYDHDGAAVHVHKYDGEHYGEHDAEDQARMRAEVLDLSRKRWEIATTAVNVGPGQLIKIQGCPDESMDGRYVVVGLAGTGSTTEGSTGTYDNELTLVPESVPFRPARHTPRPVVPGLEIATVVGPDGEEIHTDEYGRVRVRFPWDREHQPNQPNDTSCWIRPLQPWAGPGFGVLFTPRIGMEVAVSFLGGDPDQPVVVGCLYNGDNHVPTPPLPQKKTQSTIRTKSSLRSDGFNELRFEDDAGKEEIYVHAQRDFTKEVLHDRDVDVGNDERIHVHHDRRAEVDGKEHVEVHKGRRKVQHGAERETYHSSLHSSYHGNRTEIQHGNTFYREGIFGAHHAHYALEGGAEYAHVVSYGAGRGVNILLHEESDSVTELRGTGLWQVQSPAHESYITLTPTEGLVGIKATQKVGLKTTDDTSRTELTPGRIKSRTDIFEVEAAAMAHLRVGDSEIVITNDGILLRSGGSIINITPAAVASIATVLASTAQAAVTVTAPVITRGGKPIWD